MEKVSPASQSALPAPLTQFTRTDTHTHTHTRAFFPLAGGGGGGGGGGGEEELKCNLFMFRRCNTPHFPCWVKTKSLYNLFLELVSSCQEEHVN